MIPLASNKLLFAFDTDGNEQDDAIEHIMKNINNSKINDILSVIANGLQEVTELFKDRSLLVVLCSDKYIEEIEEYHNRTWHEMNDVNEFSISSIDKFRGVFYIVEKDNDALNYIPSLTIYDRDSLSDKVAVAFIKYYKQNMRSPMEEALSVLNLAICFLMELINKAVEIKTMSASLEPDTDGNYRAYVRTCLCAYNEYRYTKLNMLIYKSVADIFYDDEIEGRKVQELIERRRIEKIDDCMGMVSHDISTNRLSLLTLGSLAKAVGSTAVYNKIKIETFNNRVNVGHAVCLDMLSNELNGLISIYYDSIFKMLDGNYNIKEDAIKVKYSEKAIKAINNKIQKIIGKA